MKPTTIAQIYVRLPQPQADRFAFDIPGGVETLLNFARQNLNTPKRRAMWLKRLGHPDFQH